MRTIFAPQKMKLLFFKFTLAYIVALAVLFLFQDNLIYYPSRITVEYAGNIAAGNANVEQITLETDDSITLRGWLVSRPEAEKAPLVIYYGGNGEEVSHLVSQAERFPGCALLLMNYRGYGLSEGRPNERNLYRDAELIYDIFTQRKGVDRERIVVMGRSIGTGVAVHIAASRPVSGVILVTPYDSLVRVVQRKVKIIPAALLLRNRFDSIAAAPRLDIPMLALIAGRDEVIPSDHAYNLASTWGGKLMLVTVDNAGHNNIQDSDLFWESIAVFLSGL